MRRIPIVSAVIASVFVLSACGGKEQSSSDAAQPPAEPAVASSAFGENLTPDRGGEIITVELMTDEQGNNKFVPNDFEAHQGDVIRFTLKTGVHNVNFLADSNAGKPGLPGASALLQLPGQATDYKVALPPGKYYFQCDPHAALGMKGWLEVEGRDDH